MVKKHQLCYLKVGEKSFNSGVVIPAKMRFCNESNDNIFCNRCNNPNNGNKEFEAILNFLKNQAFEELGHMLSYFID